MALAAVAGVLWTGQSGQAVMQEWKDHWEEEREVPRAITSAQGEVLRCPSSPCAQVANAGVWLGAGTSRQHPAGQLPSSEPVPPGPPSCREVKRGQSSIT